MLRRLMMVGGAAVYNYFNPSDKEVGVTLSDSNKVAGSPGGTSSGRYARSVKAQNAGLWHVQFIPITTAVSSGSHGFGFATSAFIGSYLGFLSGSWGLWGNHSGNVRVYNNNTYTAYAVTLAVNDVVDLWIDFASGKAWWGKNGTVISGDPVAGTDPMATFTAGTTLYLCAAPALISTKIRLRTDPAEISGGTLSGFTDGWPG